MKFFGKPADPTGALALLRSKRDALEKKLAEAKIACKKAEGTWQTALDGDDSKALEKGGARLLESQNFVSLIEAEIDDYAQRIAAAETELSFAQNRAAREAKAARLDSQAAAVAPLFDHYAEVSSRFAQELAGIEGLFDAAAAASTVRQTSQAVLGAKQSVLEGTRFLAAELRRDPPPRAPDPPKLPAGTLPRGIVPDRADAHEPSMWSGNKAFP